MTWRRLEQPTRLDGTLAPTPSAAGRLTAALADLDRAIALALTPGPTVLRPAPAAWAR
jgi:hypothetical protein